MPRLGWLVLAVTAAQDVPAPSDVCGRARAMLDAGAYASAESTARLCRESLVRDGVSTIDVEASTDLLVEAITRNGNAGTAEGLALAEGAVQAKRRQPAPDPLGLAQSLHNLAAVYIDRGEFTRAATLFAEGLTLRSEALEAGAPAVADSLDGVALVAIRLERYVEARDSLEKALAMREPRAQRAPLSLARTLGLAAIQRRYAGEFPAALALVDRSLAVLRGAAPDHGDLPEFLIVRGDVLFLTGDVDGAKAAYAEALRTGERVLRPDHPRLALSLRRAALVESLVGNLSQARRLRERALRIGEAAFGGCAPDLPASLNDLALSLEYDGDYEAARLLYQRALAHNERCLGRGHSLTATVANNLAHLAALVGDLPEAERLHLRVVDAWTSAFGRNHVYVAVALDGLAEVVLARGRTAEARALYERALRIRRTSVGTDHPDVAWTLTSLARVKAQVGAARAAWLDVSNAIDIFQRVGGSDAEDRLARALMLRGEIHAARAELGEARASFAAALATRERTFGARHPLVAEAMGKVAQADFGLGSRESAFRGALDAERAGREHLQFTVRYLPERQGLTYAERRHKGLDTLLSILVDGRVVDAAQVLEEVARSRALVMDELATRARSLRRAAGASTPDVERLVAARQRVANLLVRSAVGGEPVARDILEEANRQRDEAERVVAAGSVTARAELARADIATRDIRAAMPEHGALVSFVRYDRISFQPGAAGHTRPVFTPSYVALVLLPSVGPVAVVPLGLASIIDPLVRQWHQSLSLVGEDDTSFRAIGSTLRRRIWDPLTPHLGEARTVYVVPDGALSLVPLAALPVGQRSYLLERGPVIHYLSAERDIVPLSDATPASRGLLAIGGPSFDYRGESRPRIPSAVAAPSNAAMPLRGAASLCGTLGSVTFQPLTGTRQEVRDLWNVWNTSVPAEIDRTRVLLGRDASEATFKRTAPGHRVLHLATHGFFMNGDCTPAVLGTRGVGGLTKPAASRPTANPLLLSGLALAGANRRASAGHDDDGILTAEEVASLDLGGVEWAVLSACDTGIGEIRAGEGVFGLRRAFQVAGARTIIMSLWSVDDQATRQWMRALYVGRFQRQLSTADAVHQASLSMLRARRAAGVSTHPFYWAAFVAAGDWR